MDRARLFPAGSLIVGLPIAGLPIAGLPASNSETHKPSTTAAQHVRIASIAARAEDVSSIDGIMEAYYDAVSGPAGQPRQWARESTLSKPGTQFVVIMDDEKGKPILLQLTHQQFADTMNPDAVKNGFFEHEIHRITHRYGSWAHVISTSESRARLTGPITGHGIDNVELFWDGMRWWITYASVTFERVGEPIPKEFLP